MPSTKPSLTKEQRQHLRGLMKEVMDRARLLTGSSSLYLMSYGCLIPTAEMGKKKETFLVIVEWKEGWLSRTHWRSKNCTGAIKAMEDLDRQLRRDMVVLQE